MQLLLPFLCLSRSTTLSSLNSGPPSLFSVSLCPVVLSLSVCLSLSFYLTPFLQPSSSSFSSSSSSPSLPSLCLSPCFLPSLPSFLPCLFLSLFSDDTGYSGAPVPPAGAGEGEYIFPLTPSLISHPVPSLPLHLCRLLTHGIRAECPPSPYTPALAPGWPPQYPGAPSGPRPVRQLLSPLHHLPQGKDAHRSGHRGSGWRLQGGSRGLPGLLPQPPRSGGLGMGHQASPCDQSHVQTLLGSSVRAYTPHISARQNT